MLRVLIISIYLVLLSFLPKALAVECSAVFPDALQNNYESTSSSDSDGFITLNWQAKVANSPDNILASSNDIAGNWGSDSCTTADCTSSGLSSQLVNYDTFPTGNPVEPSYRETLTLSPGNYSTYNPDNNSEVTLNLSSGDYTFDGDFNFAYLNTINVLDGGQVRIFIKGNATFNFHFTVNIASAANVLFYFKSSVTIPGDMNAFIYSEGDVTLGSNVNISGAISAKNINVGSNSVITFDDNVPDFGAFCDGSSPAPEPPILPIVDYQFDTCEYTGVDGEVIDQTGNYHGNAVNVPNPLSNGVINNALDLSAITSNPFEWLQIPKEAINGLDDFSISVWIKTARSKTEQEILHALGSGTGDDELQLALNFNNTVYLKVRDNDTYLALSSAIDLTDDNWHHILVTRDGADACLFVDGTKEACNNNGVSTGVLEVTDDNAVVIGQEQDSFGGGFDSNQSFDGQIDELKIFDSVLSDAKANEFYLNELAGKNYNGVNRDILNCQTIATTEYRFDELVYTGAAGEIIDSIAQANGRAIASQPTEGKVCNAIDLTGTDTTDYAILDQTVLEKEDFSISLWVKTDNTANFGILSGARSGSANELLMWFPSSTSFASYIRNQRPNPNPRTISIPNIADDEWHHIVWTRESDQNCLYFDTEDRGCVTNRTGELNITSLLLGQEQDSVGGGFSGSQDFVGLIDELVIFDEVITEDQVKTIFDNQDAGLGYDGSPRQCEELTPLLYMQFDESLWSGNTGEVVDQTGNFNGQALNGATTGGDSPAIVGNIGTCRYGTFNGTDQFVQIADDDQLDITDHLTITAWIYPTKIPNSDLMSILSKDTNYEFHVTSAGDINWWWGGGQFSTSGSLITPNQWHHIAITYESNEQHIYINGIDVAQNNFSGSLSTNSNPLQIGQDQGYGQRYFQGSIDEVKIYNATLSANDIVEIYQETHPCESYLDHFEINLLGGQGLTCDPDEINIKACSDTSCSTVNPDAVNVVLSVTDSNGDIVLNKDVIVAGETGVNVSYLHPEAEIVTLSLSSALSNPEYECIDPTSCQVDFKSAGFRFISNTSDTAIPLQISAKPSNQGYKKGTLYIEAVQDVNGVCEPLFVDSGVVEMAAIYQSPISGTQAVNISGETLEMASSGTDFDSLQFKDVSLDFNGSHRAEFIFTYPDAGSVTLNARYELPKDPDYVGDPALNPSYIIGSSAAVIVRPFALHLSVDTALDDGSYKDNPSATSATGSIFTAAADEFRISTRAVVWEASDDEDEDGHADEGKDLSNNAITSNFTDVSLTSLVHTKIKPDVADAVAGILSINTPSPRLFNAGVQVDTASYDEVGIISLDATYNNYLNSNEEISGVASHVGRFTPDHFSVTTLNNGDIVSYCDTDPLSSTLSFAYSGQMLLDDLSTGALGYATSPSFVIEARNSADKKTQNYIDSFDKLAISSFNREHIDVSGNLIYGPYTDALQLGKDLATNVGISSLLSDGTYTNENGVISYSYHPNDSFVYKHEQNSEIEEFPADIDLRMVDIIDDDGITAIDYDGLDNDLIFTLHPSAPSIRFGRAQLKNTYGPDTSNLPQNLSVNYFTDNGYKPNDLDICTRYDSGNITLTAIDLDPAKTPLKSDVTGTFAKDLPLAEVHDIILTAPTTNINTSNTGEVCVTYEIYPWLQYLWAVDENNLQCGYVASDKDGLFNDNPTAIATFGLFRGNDRIIYQREIAK